MLYYLNGIVWFPWDLITNLVTKIIRFLGYPRIGSSIRPSSGSSNPVFIIFYVIFLVSNIFAAQFCGAILGGILWHIPSGFPSPLSRICGNNFVVLYRVPNKISCLLLCIFFGCAVPFRLLFFSLFGKLPMVLVVVGCLFMIG